MRETRKLKQKRVASLEEEITHEIKLKISLNEEFKDRLENITIMMDRGIIDGSLPEMCSMIYLPTWRTPRFPLNSERNQVEAWVILEGYETVLYRQTEDAKKVKITECETDRSCGFFFFNDRQAKMHFWQTHQDFVNPEMNQVDELC